MQSGAALPQADLGPDPFIVWEAVSMAWTEVGLAPEDYPALGEKLRQSYASWEEVGEVARDVVWSFALESALFPLALLPLIGLFLIAPMPDWGYEESYLRARMEKWNARPRWRHFLNPLRALGYPLAWLFSLSLRRKLRAAYFSKDTP